MSLHHEEPKAFRPLSPPNDQHHMQSPEIATPRPPPLSPESLSPSVDITDDVLTPLCTTPTPIKRVPRKKALLIGIKYSSGEGKSLVGPHKDVWDMKRLLIDRYGYDEADITTLIDIDDPRQMQPTRQNMISCIIELTADARPGDRFFFHYAGHSTQVENRDNSEEDGMDECLVPSDFSPGTGGLIKDNDLRRYLVDRLPGGCSLVAVFDSCHSASLLDLEHYRCNRVYTPWISKGRRKSASLWNNTVRRCAVQPQSFKASNGPPSNTTSPVDQINLKQRRMIFSGRAGQANVRWKESSIDRILNSFYDDQPFLPAARSTALTISTDVEQSKISIFESPARYCMTPEPIWPCDGFCRDREEIERPEDPPRLVVSLSAAQDDQKSWEDKDGASMTQALIKLLNEDTTPTFRKLLTRVSHELHRSYIHLHDNARSYKKQYKNCVEEAIKKNIIPRERQTVEMDNFQDPQLSSLYPLNMDDRLFL